MQKEIGYSPGTRQNIAAAFCWQGGHVEFLGWHLKRWTRPHGRSRISCHVNGRNYGRIATAVHANTASGRTKHGKGQCYSFPERCSRSSPPVVPSIYVAPFHGRVQSLGFAPRSSSWMLYRYSSGAIASRSASPTKVTPLAPGSHRARSRTSSSPVVEATVGAGRTARHTSPNAGRVCWPFRRDAGRSGTASGPRYASLTETHGCLEASPPLDGRGTLDRCTETVWTATFARSYPARSTGA